MKLYSIKDTKIGFSAPILMQNDAVAYRTFKNMRNSEQPNMVNTNPEDKELWLLGQFDEDTGAIQSKVEFLAKAEDVKEIKQED